MFEKIANVMSLFRVGQSVADPALWKTGAISVSILAPVLMKLNDTLVAFGVNTGVSDATASDLAIGIVAIVNIIVTLISSKTVGVAPAKS